MEEIHAGKDLDLARQKVAAEVEADRQGFQCRRR
jgi:hypothetical protein